MSNSLNFISYNSNGFNMNKQLFVKDISIFSDIILIQEHFLLDGNSNVMKKLLPNFYMNFKGALKSNVCVNSGRGSGGLAIIWKKIIKLFC